LRSIGNRVKLMNKLIKRTAIILDINIYADGNGAIITSKTAENTKGVWSQTANQLARLAKQAGAGSAKELKLAGKGASFIIEGKHVKAGETYTNEKTGETGVFTKDHFRVENTSIELSPQGQLMLLAAGQLATGMMGAMLQAQSNPVEKQDEAIEEPIETPFEEFENKA
jgi:hypothetical protein